MERQLWPELSRAINDVARTRQANAFHSHDHATIVRVYLWSVLHDRPVSWACQTCNWHPNIRVKDLPHQCTMSRRMRTKPIKDFLHALGKRMNNQKPWHLLKIIDGKSLTVAAHSKDPDAAWGRGAGQKAKGYKLHAIIDGSGFPPVWEVHPLNHDEKTAARSMLPRMTGQGYLVGDKMFDASHLHDAAAANGHRLIAPRKNRFGGLGHRHHSPHRLACIESLEAPKSIHGDSFARFLMRCRKRIETSFGNLVGFGGGLTHLPPWVRRLHRVEPYVHAKLIINAARIRLKYA